MSGLKDYFSCIIENFSVFLTKACNSSTPFYEQLSITKSELDKTNELDKKINLRIFSSGIYKDGEHMILAKMIVSTPDNQILIR